MTRPSRRPNPDPAPEAPLLWVTNVAAPYREPLWRALAERVPLVVALLADHEPNRDWHVDLSGGGYAVAHLDARPLRRTIDTTFYAPSMRLHRLVARQPRALIMDGWESPAFITALLHATRLRVPTYASYRSTQQSHHFAKGPVPAVRRWFFTRLDGVLTAGSASTAAVRAMGLPPERITEGFNTVDVQSIAAETQRIADSLPERTGHRYLYVGQLIPRKNVEALIRAFASIRKEPDTLTIVGTGPDRQHLREIADQLGCGKTILWEGHLEGIALLEQYSAAMTLVLPSTEEVWGLVVNEALAAGLHVVVSTAAGVTPSISGMPGVYSSSPTTTHVAQMMLRSRDEWTGRNTAHPVLSQTPQSLAEIIVNQLVQVRHAERYTLGVTPVQSEVS